jgi:hypothetical protein
MIKFFRKIRQNLLMENKTGKYFKYAIGEIVLVMIGILLAVQVNNWNNNRIQSKKESNYIKQINSEFLLNRIQFDNVAYHHYNAYNNTKKIISLMPIDINTVNIDSLSFYIAGSFDNFTFNPQQSTINSLTNTSSFEIISNPELRMLLQNWNEIVNDYNEEEIVSRKQVYDSYIPYFEKHISFINLINGKSVFDKPNIDFSFLKDTEFENEVALRHIILEDIVKPTSGKNELELISQTITQIIKLTSQENKK